jgi:predicted secreted protein
MIEVDVCDCQMRVIKGIKGDGMMIEGVADSYTCNMYTLLLYM